MLDTDHSQRSRQVHPQIPRQSDQVDLRRGYHQLGSELRGICRVHVVRAATRVRPPRVLVGPVGPVGLVGLVGLVDSTIQEQGSGSESECSGRRPVVSGPGPRLTSPSQPARPSQTRPSASRRRWRPYSRSRQCPVLSGREEVNARESSYVSPRIERTTRSWRGGGGGLDERGCRNERLNERMDGWRVGDSEEGLALRRGSVSETSDRLNRNPT